AEFEEVPVAIDHQPKPTEEEKKARAARDRKNALRRERRKLTSEQLVERKARGIEQRRERAKAEYQEAQRQQHDGDDAADNSIAETDDPLKELKQEGLL